MTRWHSDHIANPCLKAPTAVANGDSTGACANIASGQTCTPNCTQGYYPVGAYTCLAGTWINAYFCQGKRLPYASEKKYVVFNFYFFVYYPKADDVCNFKSDLPYRVAVHRHAADSFKRAVRKRHNLRGYSQLLLLHLRMQSRLCAGRARGASVLSGWSLVSRHARLLW